MLPTLTPWHWDSLGAELTDITAGAIAGTSVAWFGSSHAIFVPFVIQQPTVVSQMFTSNGSTTGNSIDLGIYSMDFQRLVSSGLQAQSGASALQVFSLTATTLGPGRFYMAMSVNGTSSTFICRQPAATFLQAAGCFEVDLSGAGTPGTLPAQATPASIASAYLPVFGIGRDGFTF